VITKERGCWASIRKGTEGKTGNTKL